MKKIPGLFLLITLLLNACAPGIPGSRSTPIDARESDYASITPGSEWFIKTTGLIWLINPETIDDALSPLFTTDLDLTVNTVKSLNVNWLELEDIEAPTGWIIELVWQQAIRKVTARGPTSFTYYYDDSLELTWLVKAPPSTPLGRYTILATMKSRKNPDRAFPTLLVIEITQPKT
jgi:hypothetical protein